MAPTPDTSKLPIDEVIPTPTKGKPAVYSWTNIVNTTSLVYLALALNIPEVRGLIPSQAQPPVLAAVLLLNLYLRNFVTHEPITSLLPPPEKK